MSPHNSTLIEPYGGRLVDLILPKAEVDEIADRANSLPAIRLTERTLCDLELLATGAFSPLDRFVGKSDYQSILEEMRLSRGHIFPIPVALSVDPGPHVREGNEIGLCNAKNEVLATMLIEEVYEWNLSETARKVFATEDLRHPLVAEMHRWGKFNISGPLRILRLPPYHDFADLRLSPAQVRAKLETFGRTSIVAFQTRNPLHRAHEEMTKRAIEQHDAILLLHPAVGMTIRGDVDHYSRVRTYKVLADRYYDQNRTLLSLLPLAMRMAGPREALWHAVIRRNYGANFLIVGRDHASPGAGSAGRPFYLPYAAQQLVQEFSAELGVGAIPFEEMVYLPREDRYVEASQVPDKDEAVSLSGTEAREKYLSPGKPLPDWYIRPEISEILCETHQPKYRQGLCVWFTGLSCAGKSTIAEILTSRLLELGRRITLLDGDVVRTHLSKGLGFTKADRDTNIRRIGFVAAEIVRHGGVAVCAAISPYRAVRNEVRNMIGAERFIEVFVDAPLEVCIERDTKGMYARAQRGEIRNFTGLDDPYEVPEHPELKLDSEHKPAEENAQVILDYLIDRGFLKKT